MDVSNVNLEQHTYETNAYEEKQPILPFSKKKETQNTNNIFKLPNINFLEILEYHKFHKAKATMAVRVFERQNPFGVIEYDGITIKKIEERFANEKN